MSKVKIVGVKCTIMVASGKGGVGKSSVSMLLAQQLAAKGVSVGIVDLDIYGPSIPTFCSLDGYKVPVDVNNKMIPPRISGISMMSIGFLIPPRQSMAWRAPMVIKAINHIILETNWTKYSTQDGDNVYSTELEYLIIDMPPGTGDVYITMLQQYCIDDVVVVTTSDPLSIEDAARSLDLFNKMSQKVSGIVENMSYFVDENGKKSYLFAENHAKVLAETYGIPLLCSIPFMPQMFKKQQEALLNGAKLGDIVDVTAVCV